MQCKQVNRNYHIWLVWVCRPALLSPVIHTCNSFLAIARAWKILCTMEYLPWKTVGLPKGIKKMLSKAPKLRGNNKFLCMSSVAFSNWGVQLEDWSMNTSIIDRSTLNPNISGWFSCAQREGTNSKTTLPSLLCNLSMQAFKAFHRGDLVSSLKRLNLLPPLWWTLAAFSTCQGGQWEWLLISSAKHYGTTSCVTQGLTRKDTCSRQWQGRAGRWNNEPEALRSSICSVWGTF